jgi:hypothetical protein
MKDRPNVTPRAADEAGRRESRLAAALRENLRKRKEQARGRAERPKDEEPGAA